MVLVFWTCQVLAGEHIPVLDDLAFVVETKYIDASSFLTKHVEVTHMYKCQISIDRDALNLAGNSPCGLQESSTPSETWGLC
jgi:hypothetical protein